MTPAEDIAAGVERDLQHIRRVLGPDADLKSPKLDEYHRRILDWVNAYNRKHRTGTVIRPIAPSPPPEVRTRIWDEINAATPPTSSTAPSTASQPSLPASAA